MMVSAIFNSCTFHSTICLCSSRASSWVMLRGIGVSLIPRKGRFSECFPHVTGRPCLSCALLIVPQCRMAGGT